MARTKLATEAVEESTYAITLSFVDENGDAVAPATLAWTLTDVTGTVVNSRQDVAVAAPGTSVTVVLSGDDLAVGSGTKSLSLLLAVEATYNSSLGVGLPLQDEVEFVVRGLTAL